MKIRALVIALAMTGVAPLTASAVPIITGTASSTTITGSLDASDPFNLFSFTWLGGNLTASTAYPQTTLDTELVVFNDAGIWKAFDDDSGGGGTSLFTVNLPATLPGQHYFVGVSTYPIRAHNPYDGLWEAQGSGDPGAGDYKLTLDGVDYSTVQQVLPTPEPASLLLLGTGAVGLVARFRRRKQAQ